MLTNMILIDLLKYYAMLEHSIFSMYHDGVINIHIQ